MNPLVLFFLLILPSRAAAADTPFAGSAILQMTWALLVVCGLILVLYGLARKRFLPGRLRQGTIEVLELRQVMPKTGLARIRVDGRELLIGISAGNISLLTELDSTGPGEQDRKPEKNFDRLLRESQ